MRYTKTYSFTLEEMQWIRRMEKDARSGNTTGISTFKSKHLIHIIKYYFEHQRLLKDFVAANNDVKDVHGSD